MIALRSKRKGLLACVGASKEMLVAGKREKMGSDYGCRELEARLVKIGDIER